MKTLTALATLTITGTDAKSFLQGQLSNDMALLTPQRALLASCNSAQGRVQAVLTLIEREEDIVAVVAESMIDQLIVRLRKYILRSKVSITDSRNNLACFAVSAEALRAAQQTSPMYIGDHIQLQDSSVLHWWDKNSDRFLLLQPPSTSTDNGNENWLLDDIRAGLPRVFPQTHESFVAQMLNLDVLDGISFTKGCYTGQEIIARAHYRGAVKRRMFRLAAACAAPAPGARIIAADTTHAGDVVMAATVDGGCEFLAVLSLGQINSTLSLESNSNVTLKVLPLPYEVPLSSEQ